MFFHGNDERAIRALVGAELERAVVRRRAGLKARLR